MSSTNWGIESHKQSSMYKTHPLACHQLIGVSKVINNHVQTKCIQSMNSGQKRQIKTIIVDNVTN